MPTIFIDIAPILSRICAFTESGPVALEHAAALDGRDDALEVGDRREALVERLLGRERVVELNGHADVSCWLGYARPRDRARQLSVRTDNATLAGADAARGAAAKAGHDLLLHVTSWEGTLTIGADGARGRELTADATSLRVQKGTGGMKALDEGDKANIHQTIDDEVLQRRDIAFRSTSIDGGASSRAS